VSEIAANGVLIPQKKEGEMPSRFSGCAQSGNETFAESRVATAPANEVKPQSLGGAGG